MPGIKVFTSLEEALAAGYKIYERTADGYLVRRDNGTQLALAIVLPKKPDLQTSTP
ncbi:MAG: hypothetical protein GIW99_09980 [Candidatus Eremiobacteraeota bacterium]|nr:hypothetical protein [Candidatus Eremiobacteraeota bacterium]MBC5827991.1 hypothetical protein [Candidatus Eremiobacteraeota bacterium]